MDDLAIERQREDCEAIARFRRFQSGHGAALPAEADLQGLRPSVEIDFADQGEIPAAE
jgi:hypothetical protein